MDISSGQNLNLEVTCLSLTVTSALSLGLGGGNNMFLFPVLHRKLKALLAV